MKFTQSRAVPLVIFTAIIAAVIATLAFRGEFAFGHVDPEGCDAPGGAGVTIVTTDADGTPITEVSAGADILYKVRLGVSEQPSGETACNFEGGQLSVTLPNGETTTIAGGEGTPAIPLVQPGAVYEAPTVTYTVDQADATNLVLAVSAVYSGGISHKVPDGVVHPPVGSSAASQTQLVAPGIDIEVTPVEQNIFEGGNADFTATITNTGGLNLSNVRVTDSLETNCERTIDSLAVGEDTTFDCQMIPAAAGINVVSALADAVGGVPAEMATVQDTATSTVTIEAISISVDVTTSTPRVRVGNPSSFEITVLNPNTTALVDVVVTVPEAIGCERTIGEMEAGATTSYTCAGSHVAGLTTVKATAEGRVVDVGTVTNSSETDVVVFELDLVIDKTPKAQTVREGEQALFTVTVSNYGNTPLSNVEVTDSIAPGCDMALGTLASEEQRTYDCQSEVLTEDTESVITVTGTAPDGEPVENSDTVQVKVIHPNTAVAITELDTIMLRLIIQVLTITETNTGDAPLTNVYVDVAPANVRLTAESKEFIGGDEQGDGVLDPGETWEWRLVTVSLSGDTMMVESDATEIQYWATGHGLDPLGGDITFPAYATELQSLEVPISVN